MVAVAAEHWVDAVQENAACIGTVPPATHRFDDILQSTADRVSSPVLAPKLPPVSTQDTTPARSKAASSGSEVPGWDTATGLRPGGVRVLALAGNQ